MRLIDADALKEQIEPYRYAICGFEGILALIDNSPTVTVDNYSMGYQDGVRQVLSERTQGDLIKAFELLKAYCKNRECNSDCVFYRELRAGNNIEQFCGLCEIVMSDDKEIQDDMRRTYLGSKE